MGMVGADAARWACSCVLFLSACAVGAAPHGKERVRKSEIVAGSIHLGDPGVVHLMYSESVICTGSLVAPRVVLTARHCVDDYVPTHVGVGVGTRAGNPPYASITAIRQASGDLAALILDRAGAVDPYPWGGVPRIGDSIVAIGYGDTDRGTNDAGVKRRAFGEVSAVEAERFATTAALACHGDSGGPAFVDGRVVGVASQILGPTPEVVCSMSITTYVRVDAFRDFVEDAIASTEGRGPPPPPEEPPPEDGAAPAPAPESPPYPDHAAGGTLCSDTCRWASDSECDDGGPGSSYSVCDLGTDCSDCGVRMAAAPASADRPADEGGTDRACSDTCNWSADGECDDGGSGALYSICDLGTDCTDCGAR